MTKTPHDFYLAVNGKCFDVDGYYGAQCWDGAMYYSKWLGYPVFSCTYSGYAKDIWNLRKSSGILKYYDEVQRPFNDGDIIVWGECTPCPASHIAIFRKDNGNGTFVALGQNQGGKNGAFNQINFTYEGVLGGLRPKCYAGESTPKPQAPDTSGQTTSLKWIQEDGTATFTHNYIKIHKDSPDGPVVPDVYYMQGQSVKYIAKCAYKGHRWVKYIRASGGYGVVAVSGSEVHGKDPWATFK